MVESLPRKSFPRASSGFGIPAECVSDIIALSGLEGRVIFFFLGGRKKQTVIIGLGKTWNQISEAEEGK